MRILLLARSTFPYIGGIERVTDLLAQSLIARGHTVLTLTGTAPPAEDPRDTARLGPVHHLDFIEPLARRDIATVLSATEKLTDLVRGFSPDIVHFHPSGPECFVFNLARKKIAAPIVSTVHMDLGHVFLENDGNSLFSALRTSTLVTSVSRFVHNSLLRRTPDLADNAIEIFNAIPRNTRPFEPAKGRQILAFGRVTHDKGFDLMLDAFPTILESVDDASLLLAGNGPALDELHAQARRLDILPAVTFAGWIAPDAILQTIRESAVVVVPSRWEEPFGMTALEAASMGRPVIATKRGALPEITLDGATGLIVPPENPAAIAEAAIALLRDPSRAGTMGRAAYDRAEQVFDFEHAATKYEEAYTRAITQNI